MQIKAKVVYVYPEMKGTYLGSEYRFLNVIIVSDDCVGNTNIRDRYVVKFKNNNIDMAHQSGCLEGNDSFIFTVIADVVERRTNSGKPFVTTKPMLGIDVSPVLEQTVNSYETVD